MRRSRAQSTRTCLPDSHSSRAHLKRAQFTRKVHARTSSAHSSRTKFTRAPQAGTVHAQSSRAHLKRAQFTYKVHARTSSAHSSRAKFTCALHAFHGGRGAPKLLVTLNAGVVAAVTSSPGGSSSDPTVSVTRWCWGRGGLLIVIV